MNSLQFLPHPPLQTSGSRNHVHSWFICKSLGEPEQKWHVGSCQMAYPARRPCGQVEIELQILKLSYFARWVVDWWCYKSVVLDQGLLRYLFCSEGDCSCICEKYKSKTREGLVGLRILKVLYLWGNCAYSVAVAQTDWDQSQLQFWSRWCQISIFGCSCILDPWVDRSQSLPLGVFLLTWNCAYSCSEWHACNKSITQVMIKGTSSVVPAALGGAINRVVLDQVCKY